MKNIFAVCFLCLLVLTMGCEPRTHTATEYNLATNLAYLQGVDASKAVVNPQMLENLVRAMILSQRQLSTNQSDLARLQLETIRLLSPVMITNSVDADGVAGTNNLSEALDATSTEKNKTSP